VGYILGDERKNWLKKYGVSAFAAEYLKKEVAFLDDETISKHF
jgi:hypothetical protein